VKVGYLLSCRAVTLVELLVHESVDLIIFVSLQEGLKNDCGGFLDVRTLLGLKNDCGVFLDARECYSCTARVNFRFSLGLEPVVGHVKKITAGVELAGFGMGELIPEVQCADWSV